MDSLISHSHNVEHAELAEVYDGKYYEYQVVASLRSARIVLARLWKYLRPDSVLDVGCGRGAWLKACRDLGSSVLLGFDGEWNSQSLMIDSAIRFRSIELNRPFFLERRVDLAITLEVAEHLDPSSSSQFVECLSRASDAVLFSAAFTGQGGTNHINEQPHSYWAGLFRDNGYVPFDLFRPFLWSNEEVCVWYRQNTFLYCKVGSSSFNALRAAGCSELAEIDFMDCVHPATYKAKCSAGIGFKEHIRDVVPSLYRAVQKRTRGAQPKERASTL
jgi:methyltransferase family protein